MNSRNMELFKQALIEATCNVYDRELALCEQDIKCSRRHYAKMRKILGVAILPATTRVTKIKRRVLVALIAAALLLTGCTAYAYREEIKDFIETVLDDYIRVSYNDGKEPADSATITVYYTLGYVPEEYELVDDIQTLTLCTRKWETSSGKYIIFKQSTVNAALFGMDTETKKWELIQIGQMDIYYRATGINYYIWNDGMYAYQLATSTQLSNQELNSILEGLEIKE